MTNQIMNEDVEGDLMSVENNYWVELAEALTRLENGNPQPDDFKKVILEGYFKDKAVNGVSILANQGIKDSGRRSDVIEDLVAISNLQEYFLYVKNLGTQLPEDDEE